MSAFTSELTQRARVPYSEVSTLLCKGNSVWGVYAAGQKASGVSAVGELSTGPASTGPARRLDFSGSNSPDINNTSGTIIADSEHFK